MNCLSAPKNYVTPVSLLRGKEHFYYVLRIRNRTVNLICCHKPSVIRQKGESQNGFFKKTKHVKFSKKKNISYPLITHTIVFIPIREIPFTEDHLFASSSSFRYCIPYYCTQRVPLSGLESPTRYSADFFHMIHKISAVLIHEFGRREFRRQPRNRK